MAKEQKQPTIRINVLKHGVWAHNGKCGVWAINKSIAIAEIKKLYPDEYLVIDIAAEHLKRNAQAEKQAVISSEERMEIAAEMSKL